MKRWFFTLHNLINFIITHLFRHQRNFSDRCRFRPMSRSRSVWQVGGRWSEMNKNRTVLCPPARRVCSLDKLARLRPFATEFDQHQRSPWRLRDRNNICKIHFRFISGEAGTQSVSQCGIRQGTAAVVAVAKVRASCGNAAPSLRNYLLGAVLCLPMEDYNWDSDCTPCQWFCPH